MQTLAKKGTALLMAALLAVFTAIAALPQPAHAADDGSIVVKSDSAEFAGKTVTAYKMFDATSDAAGNYTYTLAAGWENFFTDNGFVAANAADKSQAAADYVRGLGANDVVEVVSFAKKASDFAKANNIAAAATAQASNAAPYTATLANLAYGYYVVSPEAGSTSATRGNDAILQNVTSATPDEVTLKSQYPTVEKKVDGNVGNTAQVGDELTFTLTSAVPDTSEYTSYVFKLHDSLSEGLTFGAVKSVTVGGAALAEGDAGYVFTQAGQNIAFDFKTIKNLKAGDAIVVTYTATLNSKAVVGGAADSNGAIGNTNKATVEYSNNPGGDGTGTSKPSITHTYDFSFDLTKVDGTSGNALEGVGFQVLGKDGATALQFVDVTPAGADLTTAAAVYRVATADDTAAKVTEVKTPKSGKITFEGLDAGTYTLRESTALDGYNPIGDLKVTITADIDQATGQLNSWTVTYGDNSQAAGNHAVKVENKKGSVLPNTGGAGTVALTAVGVLVVVGGVAWMIRRNRKESLR